MEENAAKGERACVRGLVRVGVGAKEKKVGRRNFYFPLKKNCFPGRMLFLPSKIYFLLRSKNHFLFV